METRYGFGLNELLVGAYGIDVPLRANLKSEALVEAVRLFPMVAASKFDALTARLLAVILRLTYEKGSNTAATGMAVHHQ